MSPAECDRDPDFPRIAQRFTTENAERCIAVLVLVTLVMVFQIATIRAGHSWGDDFAQYIQQARNWADGRPFAATGYIHNPDFPAIGPVMYPPLFPMLLAPVI